MKQQIQRNSGAVGTEDQRNSGYRGPVAVERCVQGTSGTMGKEDQWNSGYRRPVEQ